MIRKSIVTVVLLLVSGCALAQNTTLKANALYWAAGIPNLSVETKLGKKVTFNGDAVFSFWESVNGRPFKGCQIIAEGRFYIKEAFKGFYAGLYVAYDHYEVSKWGHPWWEVQNGDGLALGLTLGYQMEIARRWNMDFYLGGGWHHGWYDGKNVLYDVYYTQNDKSGEWIPYKAGVTFAYKLGMGKRK